MLSAQSAYFPEGYINFIEAVSNIVDFSTVCRKYKRDFYAMSARHCRLVAECVTFKICSDQNLDAEILSSREGT